MAGRDGSAGSNVGLPSDAVPPESQRKSGGERPPKVDLFVGNLSLYTGAEGLKEYFEWVANLE